MELQEGLLCPRCAAPLEALSEGGGVRECPRCGGLLVDHRSLAEIVTRRDAHSPHAPPSARPYQAGLPTHVEIEVTYLKCPACTERMNRINFGRKSGVIVDVCRIHGTWFDARELTVALDWVVAGGLARPGTELLFGPRRRPRPTPEQAIAEARMIAEAMRSQQEALDDIAIFKDLLEALLTV